MADEIDVGQERGEIGSKGVNQHDEDVLTYDTLGISRQQVHDFRKVRDAVSKGLPV